MLHAREKFDLTKVGIMLGRTVTGKLEVKRRAITKIIVCGVLTFQYEILKMRETNRMWDFTN